MSGVADDATFVGRRNQEALVAIHDHLRDEMDKLGDLVDQLRAGAVGTEAARSHVAQMTMRQNYWTLGAFCASYCRLLTLHHTIEDERLFADLRRSEPDLDPVLARLSAEHEVIAEVLDSVDRALVAMVAAGSDGGPTGAPDPAVALEEVDRVVSRLAEELSTHLDGEERALLGPIGRLTVPL